MTTTADIAVRIYGRKLQAHRLKFALTRSAPTDGLSFDEMVPFFPMEAVGDHGELDMSDTRRYEDVVSGYTRFANGDVLVAKITPCFENRKGALVRGLSPNAGFGTTELHVLTPAPELDGRFLYYVTMSSSFRALGQEHMTGAAGQKRVPTDFICDYPVWIPSAEVQKRLAGYLDTETAEIDRLIEEKERMLSLLDEQRAAVVTHAVTRGLNHDMPLRPSGLEWLGDIPSHWRIKRLKFHFLQRLEQGWSPQCDNRPAEEDEWGVLKVGCVNRDQFDPKEQKALPADLEPETRYEVKEGDILLSRGNTLELVGSASLVPNVRPRLLLCDLLYRCQVDSTSIAPELVVHQLRSQAGRFQLEREASGTSGSMKKIGQETIQNFLLLVPPQEEQAAILSFVKSRTARIDSVRAVTKDTIRLLRERRSTLITDAVTGQIPIEEMQV